jgi:hypothetical protein
MKKMFLVVVAAVVAIAVPTSSYAQARADFSGKWTYDQAKSGRGTAGNNPTVSFPTDLVIKHTPTEFDVEMGTTRQDAIAVVYKLDNVEVSVPGPAGMTVKAKAKMDGDKVLIDSKRSFSSPMGDVVNEYKEVYTLTGETLTVEKTQVIGGIQTVGKAVYNKATS